MAYSQDERFFRQVFTGELNKSSVDFKDNHKWVVETPNYQVDLDGDKVTEGIKVVKADGEDWIEIHGKLGNPFFKGKLNPKGINSSLFKINLIKLSDKTKVLVLNFYEGFTDYLQFNGSARVYLLSFDDNDLKNVKFQMGPSIWIEREKVGEQYFRREYKVFSDDFNKDGIKEIEISFNKIHKVLFYKGEGRWFLPN